MCLAIWKQRTRTPHTPLRFWLGAHLRHLTFSKSTQIYYKYTYILVQTEMLKSASRKQQEIDDQISRSENKLYQKKVRRQPEQTETNKSVEWKVQHLENCLLMCNSDRRALRCVCPLQIKMAYFAVPSFLHIQYAYGWPRSSLSATKREACTIFLIEVINGKCSAKYCETDADGHVYIGGRLESKMVKWAKSFRK